MSAPVRSALAGVYMRLLTFILACLWSFAACAQDTWNSTHGVGPTVVAQGQVRVQRSGDFDRLINRTYTSVGPTGEVEMKDLLKKPFRPLDFDAPVQATRRVPWAATAKALARGLPIISTAVAVSDLIDALRCQNPAEGQWQCDEGEPQVNSPRYTYRMFYALRGGGGEWREYTSPSALCRAYADSSANSTYQSVGPGWSVGGTVHECVSTGTPVWSSLRTVARVNTTRPDCSVNCQSSALTAPFTPQVVTDNVVQCPRGDNGEVPPAGPDGMCPTGDYVPKTPDDMEDNFNKPSTPRGNAPDLVRAADAAGTPGVEHNHPGVVVLPPSVSNGRDTITRPDGGVTVRDKWIDLTPVPPTSNGPGGWDWRERIIQQDYPPGATVPPEVPAGTPATPSGGGTTSTGAPEVKGCGLPDTPACKIDESGTPSPPAQDGDAQAEEVFGPTRSCIADPASCFPSLPTIEWGFALPTGCAVIPLPAFSPYLASVDVCQFQEVFHDLMSVVWIAGGLFGSIGLFWRKTFSE